MTFLQIFRSCIPKRETANSRKLKVLLGQSKGVCLATEPGSGRKPRALKGHPVRMEVHLAPKLPEFHGKNNESAGVFMSRWTREARVAEWSIRTMYQKFPESLCGRAYRWYIRQSWPDTGELEDDKAVLVAWLELVEKFGKHFSNGVRLERMMQDLQGVSMDPDEDLVQFLDRFEELADVVDPGIDCFNMVMPMIPEGLRRRIRRAGIMDYDDLWLNGPVVERDMWAEFAEYREEFGPLCVVSSDDYCDTQMLPGHSQTSLSSCESGSDSE